ncbi:MAG: NapC/NirT family cytochrome c [Anaeromyxobacter sp.]
MRQFFAAITGNLFGLAGAVFTTISAVLILTLFLLSLLGFDGGPYLGILAYLVLPGVFVFGLLLIPLGLWRQRRLEARARASGQPVISGALPVIDFNRPRVRNTALIVAGLTVVNLVVISIATVEGVHLMETPQFCGSCHSVMAPEFAAYQRSPHARVSCVECHIGPGAPWFVKSKLSGAWQVVSVNLDLYPRPIPTPVHNLRPARDTCEQCHWPERFVGDRLIVRTSHADDAESSPRKTVLLMHIGTGEKQRMSGIHWHVGPGVQVRYKADASRQKIGDIELTLPDGTHRTYRATDPASDPGPAAEWRTMDCIDCHNRPTHRFGTPEGEVDAALTAGKLDPALPFLRREGVRLIKAEYPSQEAGRAGIRDGLRTFYAGWAASEEGKASGKPAPDAAAVDAAAATLGELYALNVWPQMKITWGTYPTFLGHDQSPGCFRCHDEAHETEGKKTISQDCDLCHSLLADSEKDPAILKRLYQQ